MSLTRTRLFSPAPFSLKKTEKFFPKLALLLKFSSTFPNYYSQNSWESRVTRVIRNLLSGNYISSFNLLISEEKQMMQSIVGFLSLTGVNVDTVDHPKNQSCLLSFSEFVMLINQVNLAKSCTINLFSFCYTVSLEVSLLFNKSKLIWFNFRFRLDKIFNNCLCTQMIEIYKLLLYGHPLNWYQVIVLYLTFNWQFQEIVFLGVCMCACVCASVLSHFRHVWLCVTLRTVACQAPLSMGFSRQEYWSELLCSPPGDLPDPGI